MRSTHFVCGLPIGQNGWRWRVHELNGFIEIARSSQFGLEPSRDVGAASAAKVVHAAYAGASLRTAMALTGAAVASGARDSDVEVPSMAERTTTTAIHARSGDN